MRVLVDTNVILDVVCDRQPFVADAVALWTQLASGAATGCISATTLTTIFYLARKQLGTAAARQAVSDLMSVFDICGVDRAVLQAALNRPMTDFEDAVQDAAAELGGVTVIVTRNASDFTGSTLRIVDPATLAQELQRGATGMSGS